MSGPSPRVPTIADIVTKKYIPTDTGVVSDSYTGFPDVLPSDRVTATLARDGLLNKSVNEYLALKKQVDAAAAQASGQPVNASMEGRDRQGAARFLLYVDGRREAAVERETRRPAT